MKKADEISDTSLMQKAEEHLKLNSGIGELSQSESEMLKLIHDLTVRQAELELQNTELSKTILTVQNTNNKNLTPKDPTILEPIRENPDLILERWKYATEGASDGMWDWNIVTNHVFFSTQWKAMLGFSESEIGDMPVEWEKRVHPDDLQSVMQALNRNLSGVTNSFSSEYRLLCKDGSYKWVLDQGKVVKRDKNGNALRALGTHKDITDCKNTEHALKERIKELNCHNRISEVMSNLDLSINEVIEEVVRLIPAGWQFPEITQVSVQINQVTFNTPGYLKGCRHTLGREIKANGNVIGRIEICYVDKAEFDSEMVFLPEESNLLLTIAERLGSFIWKKENILLLSESEQKYRDLVENISEVIYRIDNKGIITYISSSVEKIIGFTAEEIIGKSFIHFVGVNSEFLSQRLQELSVKKELNNEYKLFTKVGEPCWIRLSTKAIFQKGNFIGAYGTLFDITEKKQFEQELEKSETLYRSILQASPDTIFIADLSGNVVLASPMAMKMFGYENIDFSLHRPLFDFIDPKDHDKATEAIRQMFQGEFSGSTEYVGIKADGSTFDMDVNGEFIRDTEGNPNSLIFIARDISDRKSAEKKLHESEALYRSVLNASPDTITITDLTGTILFISPKALEMFRYNKPEEIINRPLLDFIDEQSQAKARDAIMQMFQGNFTGAEEYIGVRSDGSSFEIEVNGDFLRDTNGQPTGIVFVTRDISDRKATEKRLKKSEEQYRRLIESINDVVFDVTIDGTIKFVSPSIEKLFNYKTENLIGRNFLSFVHPDDLAFLLEVFKNNRFDEFKSIDYRCITETGKTVWVQASAQYSYENGIIIGRTGILHDITDQKLAEEKLRQSEEQYRKLVESVNDVIYEIDAKGAIKFVSPSVIRVLGYSVEEVLGQNIFDFIYPDDRLCLLNSLENLNARDYNYMEYRYLRKDASIHWVRSSTSSIMENGVLVGGTGILTDITERKSAEQKTINATRLYAVTSHVNQAIVHLRDKDKLITEICRVAIEFGKFQMAWIGFADEESKTVKPIAFAGVEEGYLSTFKQISYRDEPEGHGPTGSAVREGKLFICDDIETDERMSVWKEEALKRGYRSSVSLPIKQSGKVIGAFTLYSSLPQYFNSEEIKLLEEIVDDISFALEAIETGKNREAAEEQYRILVESINEAIFEVNSEEIITYISPAVEKIGGYKPEELIGKNSLNFIYPDDIPILVNGLSHLGETNTPNLEYRYITKSGELCWVRTSATPIYSNGKIVGRTGSITDINKRKLAENALLDSEEKFSKAFQTAPYAISITSVEDGKFFEINDSFTAHTGYTKEEVYADSSIGLKLWANLEDRNSVIADLSQGKDVLAKEYDFVKKSGKRVSCIYSASMILLNKKPYILSSITDISEIKQAQDQLRKLSRAVEQSPVSIVITNLDGNIEYANPRACETTGYSFNELIGQNPRLLKSGETQTNEYEVLWGNISTGNEWRGVFHNKRKNGELYWESSTISPITDPNGNITHYLAIKEDITKRKETEEALSKSEEDLNNAQSIAQMSSWELNLVAEKLTWSKNYYQIMGIPLGTEMETGFFLERVHPDDLHIVDEKLEEIRNTKKPVTYDLRLRMPDKEFKWIQNNIVPEFEDGNLVRLKGVNIDITEKKLAEEKIHLQNERLSAIVGAMPDLMFVADKSGTYLEYYSTNPDLLAVSDDQIVGTNIRDLFDEKTADLHLQKISECLKKQKLVTYEFSGLDKGDLKFFEIRLAPLGSDRVLTFVRDITEEKLKDTEIKKLSLAVEQSPVLIVITDLNGTIEYVNPTFETTTGYSKTELIGQNPRILKSDATPAEVYTKMWQTISAGKQWFGELINKKKNGERYWESMSITPVRNETGKITNYLAIKQDITQRKQTEQEILDLNTNLELKIAERTSQLALTNADLQNEIEERNRIQDALSKSEKNYRSVVENVNEVIFKTDANGLWLFLNKSWEAVTGFSVKESLGKLFVNYVHPNDRQRNMELFEPLIKREKDYCRHVVRYNTKDGGFRWIEVFARLSLDENDEVTGTFGTLQDITDRKRAEDFEDELLELSLQLTGIPGHEISSAINMALKRIGSFLGADRAYIFELNPDENTMSNTYEWCNNGINPEIENLRGIPVDALPMWMAQLQRYENIIIPSVNDLPESWVAEREILDPQGIKSLIVIPVLIDINLIGFVGLDSVLKHKEYDSSEINILHVWSNMLSGLINNQRKELIIEQTRRNYETFFNTIDDFLFVLDEQGNILHTNNTVTTRLGYAPNELLEKSVLMVHPVERREEAGRIVGEMLAGTTDFCPVPLLTKASTQISVETRVKPGYWDGKPVIFGVSKDVSKIRLSEEKFSRAFHSNSALMAISTFEDGMYMDVNNTFLETLGYSNDEIIGKTANELDIFVHKGQRSSLIKK